ncbi:MAG: T9SS type A sorting domain-containing protein [Bacteroidota bacterium]|nr:T9SS type A sorting domain-containing protein [Bacteroidota bacterium]
MKKRIFTLTVFLFVSTLIQAQTPINNCGTMEYLQKQKDADPALENKMLLYEEQVQQWISQNSNNNNLGETAITIPVVFHIVYKTDSQNVSDLRVSEAIEMLNRDFAGLNTHSMGAFSTSLKANTGIQFCLAMKAPNGMSSNGIERRYTVVDTFYNNNVKYYSTGGLDTWDPTKYLNVWICNMYHPTEGYRMAYGQFPTSGINATYGLVVPYVYFGRTGVMQTHNNGAITSHEVGHCLSLYHVWGDDNGACTGTDNCNDVPNQANWTAGDHSGVITDACSPSIPGIMYMNFMDYSWDSTVANFTPNQTSRIQALFASPSGLLRSLVNSDACSAPTSCEIPTVLKATSITRTSAILVWTNMYNALSYAIRYRKVGVTAWTNTTASTNSKAISGLVKNTSYEFQVQNVCGSGSSIFSASKTFKTLLNANGFTSGIEEQGLFANVQIYPNPAKEQVSISYKLENTQNVEVNIKDILGRIVKSEMNHSIQGNNSFTIDLSTINRGLYFVELAVKGQAEIFNKLIVE